LRGWRGWSDRSKRTCPASVSAHGDWSKKQHYVEQAGFDSREGWLGAWQASRSHQVFFVGSKDETAGNQLCRLQKATDGTCTLKIRIPDRLLAAGEAKYLIIGNVTFGYDYAALDAAIESGIALSWRLHRDERGWLAFVSLVHHQTNGLNSGHPLTRVMLENGCAVISTVVPMSESFTARHISVGFECTTGAWGRDVGRATRDVTQRQYP
jgi:hypothetical protein